MRLGLRLRLGRPDDIRVGFRLKRRAAGRTDQGDLAGCDRIQAPFVDALAFRANERLGARHSENRDMVLRFYKHTGQSQVWELGAGRRIGQCPIRWAAGRGK